MTMTVVLLSQHWLHKHKPVQPLDHTAGAGVMLSEAAVHGAVLL